MWTREAGGLVYKNKQKCAENQSLWNDIRERLKKRSCYSLAQPGSDQVDKTQAIQILKFMQ